MSDNVQISHEEFAKQLYDSVTPPQKKKYSSPVTSDTDFDLQEELRKKFDELFGPLD